MWRGGGKPDFSRHKYLGDRGSQLGKMKLFLVSARGWAKAVHREPRTMILCHCRECNVSGGNSLYGFWKRKDKKKIIVLFLSGGGGGAWHAGPALKISGGSCDFNKYCKTEGWQRQPVRLNRHQAGETENIWGQDQANLHSKPAEQIRLASGGSWAITGQTEV